MVKIKSTRLHEEQKEKENNEEESNDEVDTVETSAKEYNYLLGMPMWNLTYEKVEELKK